MELKPSSDRASKIRITGAISCLVVILFAYQHCGKLIEKQVEKKASSMASELVVPPTSVSIDTATGDECGSGGLTLSTYIDQNINGKYDTNEVITNIQSVCNGVNGIDGVNGLDGKSGGIIVTAAVAGTCAAGGITVKTYVDTNNNGVLDLTETYTSTSSICNGVAGSDGKSSELTTTAATYAQCAFGGVVYTSTTTGEAAQSNVICNGKDGASATLAQKVASTSQCPTGGTVLEMKNDGTDPVYAIICNGVAGEKGSAGTSSYITTSVASPFQCKNGGVVISTWMDSVNPKNEVICNGEAAGITTENADIKICPSGGVVVKTTTAGVKEPKTNVICNGAKGDTESYGPAYISGYVGPLIEKKNISACHHDFMYFPATGDMTSGWLTFRHQRNGSEDQGIGTTGFNVWNVDIANFALASEVGNVTYCNMTYNPKEMTLSYTVVDKTDGMAGKSGVIKLK